MRILVAPDKFKGSLGAGKVGECIAAGIHAVFPEAQITIQPIADGGEGTADIIRRAQGGDWVECAAHDALGREITARYGSLPQTKEAVFEMSAAAGLAQIKPNERAPLRASTFGVGEILRAAAKGGAQKILVGLGGSATNDGGSGMARALGFRFLGSDGREMTSVAELQHLARIERPHDLALPPITAVSDVRNPLLGPRGATQTFAAQKGATKDQLEILERALTQLADVVAREGRDFREAPGAGAAGGLGFGFLAFCKAELRPGLEIVAEAIHLRDKIARADYVITGEGKLDRQTLEGKAPAGVARMAREFRKPVFAIVGRFSGDEEVRALFDGISSLENEPPDLPRTAKLLEQRGRELAETWRT